MSLTVYRDDAAGSIVVETSADGTLGAFFANELHAVGNGDGTIGITNRPKSTDTADFYEAESIAFASFVDQSGSALGADEASTVNALNAIFNDTGSATGDLPTITSSLAVTVADGSTVNYLVTADKGVGYEWSSIPAGLAVTADNPRRLYGVVSAGVGTYNIGITAYNYNGSDAETLMLTVTSSFANTKSINFENQDYMGANAALLASVLGRTGNGSGSADAWSISLWYKASTNNQGQTIFYFGDNDTTNAGAIELRQTNTTGGKRLRLRYGSTNNYIQLSTAAGTLVPGTWVHLLVTYDGGTTGASSGSISDYYGRFGIYIDGASAATTDTNSNFGYSGGVDADNLRIGRFASGSYMRGTRVDEVAIWGSDQSANVADIYNGGTPFDLDTLATSPDHWWRMGDGDTFPTIQDNVGSAHFVMYNMTVADIVTDAP